MKFYKLVLQQVGIILSPLFLVGFGIYQVLMDVRYHMQGYYNVINYDWHSHHFLVQNYPMTIGRGIVDAICFLLIIGMAIAFWIVLKPISKNISKQIDELQTNKAKA